MSKDTFVGYTTWTDTVDELEDADAGRLFKALLHYLRDGDVPDKATFGIGAYITFTFIRTQLDRDAAKYKETCEKRSAAGSAGREKQLRAKRANAKTSGQNGQMPNLPNASGQNGQKHPDNEYDNDCDNDYEGDMKGINYMPFLPDLLEAFEKFWDAWPSSGRALQGKTLNAFKEINPDQDTLDAMLKAIETQKQSEEWKKGLITAPYLWLKARRWEDGDSS